MNTSSRRDRDRDCSSYDRIEDGDTVSTDADVESGLRAQSSAWDMDLPALDASSLRHALVRVQQAPKRALTSWWAGLRLLWVGSDGEDGCNDDTDSFCSSRRCSSATMTSGYTSSLPSASAQSTATAAERGSERQERATEVEGEAGS